jgi:hypothetical protein
MSQNYYTSGWRRREEEEEGCTHRGGESFSKKQTQIKSKKSPLDRFYISSEEEKGSIRWSDSRIKKTQRKEKKKRKRRSL